MVSSLAILRDKVEQTANAAVTNFVMLCLDVAFSEQHVLIRAMYM